MGANKSGGLKAARPGENIPPGLLNSCFPLSVSLARAAKRTGSGHAFQIMSATVRPAGMNGSTCSL